ncbi:hypothetical protein GCM10010234_66920 [Streptomyces hawaiiensis]
MTEEKGRGNRVGHISGGCPHSDVTAGFRGVAEHSGTRCEQALALADMFDGWFWNGERADRYGIA